MTLYTDLRDAGLPLDNHESDLYVQDSKRARAIIAEHGKTVDGWNVQQFRSAIDGEYWLEIPFAFPFNPYRKIGGQNNG